MTKDNKSQLTNNSKCNCYLNLNADEPPHNPLICECECNHELIWIEGHFRSKRQMGDTVKSNKSIDLTSDTK